MAQSTDNGDPEATERREDGRPNLLSRARSVLAPRFTVQQRLRDCGAWRVFAARDTERDGRPVLLSVLERACVDPPTVEEIRRGLAWAKDVMHPHVVPVADWGTTDEFVWFATRRDVGRPLPDLIADDGPADRKEALRLARQLCSCLVLLHRAGRSHGALCGSDILIDGKARARIANLGVDAPILAYRIREGADAGEPARNAAPEVLAGGAPTPQSDQYAAACILRDALDDDDDAPDPVLARALSPDPADRFPDITAFLNALVASWTAVAAPAAAPAGSKRPPVVLVPAPLEEGDADYEPPQPTGPGFLARGVATLVTAGGLMGAFFVGRTAFADAETPPTRTVAADTAPGPWASSAFPVRVYDPGAGDDANAVPAEPEGAADGVRSDASASTRSTPPARPRRSSRDVQPDRASASTTSATPRDADTRVGEPSRPVNRFGRLYMNTYPWGTVYVNGRRIGNTPIVDFPIRAGVHTVRVEREGFEPYREEIQVEAGGELRRTGIILEKQSGA